MMTQASSSLRMSGRRLAQLVCLDVLIIREKDVNVKLLVYRKPSHKDQYLSFNSHHPLHEKLGVIRTLLDRCQNIVTDDKSSLMLKVYLRLWR